MGQTEQDGAEVPAPLQLYQYLVFEKEMSPAAGQWSGFPSERVDEPKTENCRCRIVIICLILLELSIFKTSDD